MKIIPIFTTILLATQQIYSAEVNKTPEGYTNTIIQIPIPGIAETALEVSSTSSGKRVGKSIATDGGSVFELWTVLNGPPNGVVTTFIAKTDVRQFNPQTKITIQTDDPYNDPENPAYINQTGPRRTRADKQFSVNVKVEGLLTDKSKDPSYRMINLYRETRSYFPSNSQIPISNNYTPEPTIQIAENNDLAKPLTKFPYTTALNSRGEISLEDKIKYACGEEIFTAKSLEYKDTANNTMPAGDLDKKTIQIWPKSRASIGGIVQGQIIKRKVPEITLNYKDLYPLSNTFAIIYPGKNKQANTGRKFDENGVSSEGIPVGFYPNTKNESFSPKPIITQENFDTFFPTNGWWTVEIITTTPRCPWEPESLCYVEFEIARSITINASLTTSE